MHTMQNSAWWLWVVGTVSGKRTITHSTATRLICNPALTIPHPGSKYPLWASTCQQSCDINPHITCKMVHLILVTEKLTLLTAWASEALRLDHNHSCGNTCSETITHEGRQQTPLMFHGWYSYIVLTAVSHLNMTASAEQWSIYSRTNSVQCTILKKKLLRGFVDHQNQYKGLADDFMSKMY